tara:strand:+ start:104 stop:523 length:420 start_codon:yes stop_codon:yes gene_type:complete
MNNSELLKALDNENNKNIVKLSSEKIADDKNEIFNQLFMSNQEKKKINDKLKDYVYVDDLDDIKIGSYIRWISIKNPDNIKLTNGGLLCEIKYLDDGCHLLCKNNFNMIMQINMETNLIFQKLNNQEKVILNVIDYLNK